MAFHSGTPKKSKKSPFTSPLPTPSSELTMMADEYTELSSSKKLLEARMSELRKSLMIAIEQFGREDTKKNKYFEIRPDLVLKKEVRHQVSLNEDIAKAILMNKGQTVFDACTTTQTTVDASKVRNAVEIGLITEDELGEMLQDKQSFSFYINRP